MTRFKVETLWRDEEGMTTIGMVVAMMVTLALIFTAAQTYRVSSASAEIQEVADIAALAAENEVAEFMVAVRLCDAVILSMSLLGVSLFALGAVACCVPAAASFSEKLIDYGTQVVKARNSFTKKAVEGLNAFQKALPFLAAANAAAVAAQNNDGVAQGGYYAVAVLVPSEGIDFEIEVNSSAEELGESIKSDAEGIRSTAEQVEVVASEAQAIKERAFAADCGNAPEYCMQERAEKLAGLTAAENPLYKNVDAWGFSVALDRAQAYYQARYEQEVIPSSGSVEARGDSALRKRFYQWASDELSKGYVVETEDSFSTYFPLLFKNVEELRGTSLYSEAVYPVTGSESAQVMHAWKGCPTATGFTRMGSVGELETGLNNGTFSACSQCEFTPSSLGNVAAASTSINNGFEYHYRIVAEAAAEYAAARAKLDPLSAEVKSKVGGYLNDCVEVIKQYAGDRLKYTPPGYKGAVALVVNANEQAASAGFESLFVRSDYALGSRAAVSGATLVPDSAHDGANVITSLLDGLGQDTGAATGAARVALDCWASFLVAFSEGQEALSEGVKKALNSLPLASKSGLGDWAAKKILEAFDSVGLESAELSALKPVLVNTSHVVNSDGGNFAVIFRNVKQQALGLSESSRLFGGLVDEISAGAYDMLARGEEGIVLAEITFPVSDEVYPITLVLPPAVASSAKSLVDQGVAGLQSLAGSVSGVKVWR